MISIAAIKDARVRAQGMVNGVFPIAEGIVEIGEMITRFSLEFSEFS